MINGTDSAINKTVRDKRLTLFLKIILIFNAVMLTILSTYFIPVEPRTYNLPARLHPAQQLFRYQFEDSIYIPSMSEKRVDRFFNFLLFKMKYGGLLKQFEKPKQEEIIHKSQEDPPGIVEISDTELLTESLLYVALPAYIAGSREAGFTVEYGYEFEIAGKIDELLSCTIITINGHIPTLEEMKKLVSSKTIQHIEARSYEGRIFSLKTSLYGAWINAHYSIKELWKFSDLMRFDLADITGDSGGAATAYEVMLKRKGIANKDGEFVITGAIDVEGNITSVGGVKAKTYLAIKNSVPVMFVPEGLNYSEAIEMKKLMKSNIEIVPMQKLGDIEAYWSRRDA